MKFKVGEKVKFTNNPNPNGSVPHYVCGTTYIKTTDLKHGTSSVGSKYFTEFATIKAIGNIVGGIQYYAVSYPDIVGRTTCLGFRESSLKSTKTNWKERLEQ